jgi:transposase
MPALVAARFNPDLKARYLQLVQAGKPAKVTMSAIIRKLSVLANALLKAKKCIGFESPSAPRLERTRSGGA